MLSPCRTAGGGGGSGSGQTPGTHRKALMYLRKEVKLFQAEQGKGGIRAFHRAGRGFAGLEKRGQQPGRECMGFFVSRRG